jgi:hypothetical protein
MISDALIFMLYRILKSPNPEHIMHNESESPANKWKEKPQELRYEYKIRYREYGKHAQIDEQMDTKSTFLFLMSHIPVSISVLIQNHLLCHNGLPYWLFSG